MGDEEDWEDENEEDHVALKVKREVKEEKED